MKLWKNMLLFGQSVAIYSTEGVGSGTIARNCDQDNTKFKNTVNIQNLSAKIKLKAFALENNIIETVLINFVELSLFAAVACWRLHSTGDNYNPECKIEAL